VFGEHIIPFNTEPTVEQIEDTVALFINEGIMKLRTDLGFYARNKWTLTYEEIKA